MKKNISLRIKLLRSLGIFTLLLVTLLIALIYNRYYYSVMDSVTETAFDYTRTAATMIDGDRIQHYVETGEKDEYYETIQDYLNAAQLEAGMKYYYVFVPYEDDLVYVWDADLYEGACELGQHEDYMSDESKAMTFSIYRQDPPEEIQTQDDEKYGFIASAYSPVFNSAGEPVAVVGVDVSIPNIHQNMMRFIIMMLLGVLCLTLISQAVFYSRIDSNLLSPINLLTESAKKMVSSLESDEKIELDIHTGDELEELANAIVKMDGDLSDYIRQLSVVTAEKERIGAELNVATQIQADMLPRIFPAFPDINNIDIYASMTPAKEVGGDFYDFFLVDDDHLALVIADVSGKGVPAALFMVIAKTLIKNSVQSGMSPGEALAHVNDQLCEGNEAGLFVTVWLALIELSTGRGISVNAGHEHPAVYSSGGEFALDVYRHAPAAAAMEGMRFREREFTLQPGDKIFVYTDGATEATDTENNMFGEERLIKALNEHKSENLEGILNGVKQSIDEFVGEAPQFDDLTMLAFEFLGKSEK
ncbi:MAG: PP2C family protein-serine/threonine phosphatase [Mogibacterium sp.]|nr:PP2C family protein-serine/threonine phosphatase [Mogibacterium sp.]